MVAAAARAVRPRSYIRSITSLYFSSITRRFTFRVGVSSPASMRELAGEQGELLDLLELGEVGR